MDNTLQYPEEKSKWKHKSGTVYVVEKITNKQATKPDYPITVVYSDEKGVWWSHPLEYWYERMTLVE